MKLLKNLGNKISLGIVGVGLIIGCENQNYKFAQRDKSGYCDPYDNLNNLELVLLHDPGGSPSNVFHEGDSIYASSIIMNFQGKTADFRIYDASNGMWMYADKFVPVIATDNTIVRWLVPPFLKEGEYTAGVHINSSYRPSVLTKFSVTK